MKASAQASSRNNARAAQKDASNSRAEIFLPSFFCLTAWGGSFFVLLRFFRPTALVEIEAASVCVPWASCLGWQTGPTLGPQKGAAGASSWVRFCITCLLRLPAFRTAEPREDAKAAAPAPAIRSAEATKPPDGGTGALGHNPLASVSARASLSAVFTP